MNRALRAATALTTVAVALMVGCSAESGDVAAQDQTSAEPESTEPERPKMSPLDEYLGEDAVSFEDGMTVALGGADNPSGWPSEEDLERIRRYDELVAECMREAGFEYVVRELASSDLQGPLRDAYSLPPEEFAAQYGHGISTVDREEHVAPDPNGPIREQMSDEERQEYDVALYGDRSRTEGSGDNARADASCAEEAQSGLEREFTPELATLDSSLLHEELSVLQGRIESDERIAGVTADWSACMHDRGFTDVADIGDAQVIVINRWDDLTGNVEGQEPVDVAASDLEEMREFEIEITVADHECRIAHYQETFENVVYEHEKEFVDQHKELLESFRAALKADLE